VKNFLFIFLLLLYTSCDDGDIIITSFEFEDESFQLCRGAKEHEYVFFKINSETNEAISYNFVNATYNETPSVLFDPITINLEEEDNLLIYRQFNTTITADYYCNNIPNSTILVTEELISTQGTATITVNIIDEDDNDGVDPILESPNLIDPQADPDNDGIPNYLDDNIADNTIGDDNGLIEEGFDSDGDLIPDFKDQDDDNDNILTSAELPNGIPNDDSFQDTDGDEIPNYLDADDDNDGILSRNEDINANGNPRDDDTDNDGIPNYLDSDDDGDGIPTSDEGETDDDGDMIPNYLDTNSDDDVIPSTNTPPNAANNVSTTYRTELSIENLDFNETNGQFTNDRFSFGFKDTVKQISTKK